MIIIHADPPRYDNNVLLYGLANLPDKIELWAFLCFNLKFIPFSPKIRNFLWVKARFLGHFRTYFITHKDYFPITIIINCNGSVWGLIIDIRGGGGGMQRKESPDFRFPEVGISGLCTTTNNSWHYSCPALGLYILSVNSILASCVALWNIPIHNGNVHTFSIQ